MAYKNGGHPKQSVAMLVNNPCVNDSRVIREAEALAAAGYEVTVLARRALDTKPLEERNGVRYIRLTGITDSWVPRPRRISFARKNLRSDPYRTNFVLRTLAEGGLTATAIFRTIGIIIAYIFSLPLLVGYLIIDGLTRVFRWITRFISKCIKKFASIFAANKDKISALMRDARIFLKAPAYSALNTFKSSFISLRKVPAPKVLKKTAKWVAKKVILPAVHLPVRWLATLGAFANRGGKTAVSLPKRWSAERKTSPMAEKSKAVGSPKRWITTRIVSPSKRWAKRVTATRIVSPTKRWAKRWIAAAFIFEVVDLAMRRKLIQLRPDIIHAHDLMTLPTASRAAQDIGARLVYDSHELELHRNASYPKLAWWRRAKLETKHIAKTDLVITVSDSIADHLRDEYSIPRPSVIMNTPLLTSGDAEGPGVRQFLNLDAETPLALYVGSVTINRGIEICVQALAHYPELHFATVGPRHKVTQAKLLDIAREMGVEDRLHLVDPVPADRVVSFVRDASVSVLPIQNVCLSYYYCMPNKLFESVFSGLPVVVADLVELRRFVERYPCGLIVDETNPLDVARAIREIVANREEFILSPQKLEEIRGEFSWPMQAEKLVSAYRRMSGTPARAEALQAL